MKHYSASLVGQANQVDDAIDSRLQIGDNDSLEIAGANTSGNTGVGLIITSMDPETKYLRGDGQEALITDLQLDLEGISMLHVPLQNATGDNYVDSQIIQSGVGTGGVTITLGDSTATSTTVSGGLTVNGDTTLLGSLNVTGTTNFEHSSVTTYSDTFLELNVAQDKTTGGAGPGVGGILVEDTFTPGAPPTNLSFGGWRFNGAFNTPGTSDSAGRWEYNLGAAADGSGGQWRGYDEDFVASLQAGQGLTVVTTGTADGLTATPASPRIDAQLTATAITAGVGRGGLQFDGTSPAGTFGIADNGIAENMLNVTNAGTAGQVLSLVAPAGADADAGRFQWIDAQTGTGDVRKVIQNIATDADASGDGADEVYTVDTTTANAGISDANLGINLIVSVYEFVNGTDDSGGISQVIPQSTVISSTAVVVTIPNDGFNGRIVVTG